MPDEEDSQASESSSLEVVESPKLEEDISRQQVYFDTVQGNAAENDKGMVGGENNGEEEEDDDAYRRRVYGEDNFGELLPRSRRSKNFSSFRRLSRQLSSQLLKRRSSIVESLPETPAGWTVLLSIVMSSILGYEMRLQKSLTKPPIAFGQLPKGSVMAAVHQRLTAHNEAILSRPIQPSLFVGTRGLISSTAAYLLGGPSSNEEFLRFRDIITSPFDGARVAIDWEVPWKAKVSRSTVLTAKERQDEILSGPIKEPVVVILHGINNDASFGYIKALARSFVNRGWNAASMNFRGTGGVPLATPRGYNGGYTGDLRSIVWNISARLDKDVPIFLVGNSLGANIMTKYLGEEGFAGTLPKCVSGAASLGNPLSINSSLVKFPFNIALALGVKEQIFHNFSVFSKFNERYFKDRVWKLITSPTIAQTDEAIAPVYVRNGAFYPFAFKIGFKNGNSYWTDASSYRLVRYIPVPFLNLKADDDFLVAAPNRNKLGFLLSNPNVMVAETRCGGHLGWQERPPDSNSAFGAKSWADAASADFFEAVMASNQERHGSPLSMHSDAGNPSPLGEQPDNATLSARRTLRREAEQVSSRIRPKL